MIDFIKLSKEILKKECNEDIVILENKKLFIDFANSFPQIHIRALKFILGHNNTVLNYKFFFNES